MALTWETFYEQGCQRSIVGQAKKAGWQTVGAGKVFHTGKSGLDMADWDEYFHTERDQFSAVSMFRKSGLGGWHGDFGPIPDSSPPMFDDRTSSFMISKMKTGATGQFWCYGTFRPHLPFIVPQRFFNLFPSVVEEPPGLMGKPFDAYDTSELALLPEEAQKIAPTGLGRKLQSTGEYNAFLRAYLASISYADDVIGRILSHMRNEDLLKSTLVVLWSDHGWQLGEKLCFRKFTLWERALKVPLFIAGPGIIAGQCNEPVSLLDIYPTLLSVLGVEPPHHVDGQNLVKVLSGCRGRGFALSAWERRTKRDNMQSRVSITVRDRSHRLILYPSFETELYETETDKFERNNLLPIFGHVPSNLEPIVDSLIRKLPVEIHSAQVEKDPG